MTKKDNGGAAFPGGVAEAQYSEGMTLRDWFATQDITGGNVTWPTIEAAEAFIGRPKPSDIEGEIVWQFDVVAKLRYMAADAMLEARK